MESGKILESDYLDLIYDNRNKNYGGYELRKHYTRRATKALSITCAVILLAIGGPVVVSKLNAKGPVINGKPGETIVAMTDVYREIPKPPEPPKPPKPPVDEPPAPPKTAETIKNPVPKIVRDNNVLPNEKPPDTKELQNKLSGPVTSPGEEGDVIAMTKEPRKGPFGDGYDPNGDKEGKVKPVISDEPVRAPDEMPEFPGGMKALAEYLRRNLNYPAVAREDNIQGRVVITFVVNAQGAIEGAKVSRAIGGGCDREALRVVNAMPKWKPGKQNGRNVKVFYTLPISFKLDS